MSDALVDPEMIPKIDTSYVTSAAENLRAMGSSVGDSTDGMATAWAGLKTAGVYEAPESATVYSLLDPAATAADDVESALSDAADAMDTFADALEKIKPDLDAVRSDVAEFREKALKGVDVPVCTPGVYSVGAAGTGAYTPTYTPKTEHKDWWDSPTLCEENSQLFARINDQVAKIINAENECANTLRGLIPDQNFEQQPTNVTGEALDQLDNLPWGQKTEYEPKNCGESAVMGIGDGVKGLLEGGASLISYNPRTGQWGDWDHAGQAWSGLGNLGLSLVVVASPLSLVSSGMRLAGVENSFTQFVEEKELTVANTVTSLVNIDLTADDPFAAWKKDGVRALFSSATNIGTLFIPGADAGSVLKLGAGASTTAKASSMALRGVGTIADMIVPGGSFIVKSAGEFGVKVVDVAAHGGEGVSLATRASTAIENSVLHDLGKVDGLPVKDGSGLDLGRVDVGKVDAPSLADAGGTSATRGLDGLGDSTGGPGLRNSSKTGVPDLGEGTPARGSDSAGSGGSAGDRPGATGSSSVGEGPRLDSDGANKITADAQPGRPGAENPGGSPETPRRAEGGNPVDVSEVAETGVAKRTTADGGVPEAGPEAAGGRGDGAGSSSGGAHGDGELPTRRGEPDGSADVGEARPGESGGRHGDHSEGDASADAAARDGSARDEVGTSREADAHGRDTDAGAREDTPARRDETRPEVADEQAQKLADETGKDRPGWDNKTDWPERPDAKMSDGTVEVTHDGGQTVAKSSDGHVTVADGEASIKTSSEGLQVHHADGDFTVNERGELTDAPEGTTVRRGEDGSWSIESSGPDPVRISRDADGIVTVQHGDTTVRQLDGTIVADAGDGLYTKVHADGTTHVTQLAPDGGYTTLFEDGTFLHRYPDGGFEPYGDPRLGGGRDFEGTVDPSKGLSDSGLTRNGKLDDPANVPPEIQELVDKGVVSIDDKGVVRSTQKVTEDFTMRETAESYRQAGFQEHGMNDLTQDIREDNMDARADDKNWGDSEKARYRRESERSLAESLEQQGVPADQAKTQAKDMLSHHEALHGPDRVIGGNPDNFTGFGTETVPGNTANSEMGRHWSNHDTVGDFNRRMRDAFQDIPEAYRGDVRVNTEFLVNGKTTNFTGLP
ncbi:polymorphic toxin type 15 domain-containing protein [Propionibacterium australiense]|uniref:Novel toxin 15 n=1 Tax=Propionibacterium australiense TaxID=119981 RepID=A0A383S8I5_9ACTN|nr:polymorphic toxin type 15 domain-containing protein [Propionibacterium australiense]RLP06009.1 hypothetical protein D9T14_12910 [Propionibacterium australiense]RLP06220.1 hypothetical protein D7U36_13145 [Propionibacterium australiense]SYZ34278.1 Novel toxin 15 [Propionibacterium australiense]VEH92185.1 Uncharacterised protein [Propionibacterium australiense]